MKRYIVVDSHELTYRWLLVDTVLQEVYNSYDNEATANYAAEKKNA